MSSYGEKHTHTATCCVAQCDDDAPHLVVIRGVPNWVCDKHKELGQ